jgi:addiction module HigA family antidote
MSDDMITRSKMRPAHPGAILARVLNGDEECVRVSVVAAAKALGVSRQTLHRVLSGKAGITLDMAMRIGAFVGNGPGLWLRMQSSYDLWHAEHDQKVRAKVISIDSIRKGKSIRAKPLKRAAAKRDTKRAQRA